MQHEATGNTLTLMVITGLSSSSRENGVDSRFLLRNSEDKDSVSRLWREILGVEDDGATTDLALEEGRDASEPLVDMDATGEESP